MFFRVLAAALVVAAVVGTASAAGCADWHEGACVCTEKDCDFIESALGADVVVGKNAVVFVTSGKTKQRLERTVVDLVKSSEEGAKTTPTLSLNTTRTHQSIIGFGGAFTDAATINFNNVSNTLQDKLLNSYYGQGGLDYSLGRIPMAACDFSAEEYSYDDTPEDYTLSNFSIKVDEESGRIDLIRAALALTRTTRQRNITLFASPWSAPAWMKTNNKRVGGQMRGVAGDAIHQTWAEYFVKFVSAFEAEGIPIWGVTVQNEPMEHVTWDSCHFSPEMERDFIKLDLGPKMRASHPNVKIMMLDDQFRYIEKWGQVILDDPATSGFVDGVGFHWYLESELELHWYQYLSRGADRWKDKFFLATEASEGFLPTDQGPRVGSWIRAARYAHDIIQDINHGAGGWTDWNIFLDTQGGPNHARNWLDAPIIIDAPNDRFFKNPMYYALGHFSKFVPPGSLRIDTGASGDKLLSEVTAFVHGDGSAAVVVLHNQHPFGGEDVIIKTAVGDVKVHAGPLSITTVYVPLK